ncbi:hypothetical protein [Kitasatospora cinereorecta]|uniref:SMP-30/Gluconolactonase/LRE-like region domain-containing protein n=1 Tax=Kitasatospora cinereorecta TaxID=285560 RepID=A0ABW0VGF6_9ACTN
MSRHPRLGAAACATALALGLLAAAALTPATAVSPPLSDPRILVHFDLAAGQMPENIAMEPDGSADLTLIRSRQVVRVSPSGEVRQLAQMPEPADPATPVIGFAAVTGIARAHDGTLYFHFATGTDATGVYRLAPGGTPELLAALPPDSFPNGLALDEHRKALFSADSVHGVVRRIPLQGGPVTTWASGPELAPSGFIGVNGVRMHKDSVWVTNTDAGTLLRIPFCPDGTAGPIETRARDLTGIDDFGFTDPGGDTVLAALDTPNQVAYVRPDGTHTIVLTGADGLSNPTSVAVLGDTVHVTSAAFATTDPNLLLATLDRKQ